MLKEKKLNFNYVSSNEPNNKVIIAIHGWSGSRNSFLPLTKNKIFKSCNWFLPEAPYNLEMEKGGKTWSYEIEKDVWEINEPRRMLNDFFENEVFNKYDSRDVYVMGFSQGALICYEFVCGLDKPLGAIFAISGFLRKKENPNIIHTNQLKTPILISHGIKDEVVSVERSKEAYNLLKQSGANVNMHLHNNKHRMPGSLINIIGKMINK